MTEHINNYVVNHDETALIKEVKGTTFPMKKKRLHYFHYLFISSFISS